MTLLALDADGAPLTGLAVVWTVYKDALTGLDLAQPGFTESAAVAGVYYADVADDATGIADAGATALDRLHALVLTREDVVTFAVYDVDDAVVTGLAPAFSSYVNIATGVALADPAAPAVTELGGGLYRFTPNHLDVQAVGSIALGGTAFPDVIAYDGFAMVAPEINFITGSPIEYDDPVVVDVTDASALALVMIHVNQNGALIYDGSGFTDDYAAGSLEEVIAGGVRYTFVPDAGWTPGPLSPVVHAVDEHGNLATGAQAVTVNEPVPVPGVPEAVPASAPQAVGDFALTWDAALGTADLSLSEDDVLADQGLRTALLLSLFTDRRAEDEDVLPAGDDRRGWWADELAERAGDRFGSRLWLLERSSRRADIVPRAEELAREALAWMLEDKVAERIDVLAEASGDRLALLVTVHRPGKDPTTYRFAHAWDGEQARSF